MRPPRPEPLARTIDLDGTLRVIRVTTPHSRLMGFAAWVTILDNTAIDSGFTRARRDLLPGLTGSKIEQIALTHEHEDHTGNAAFIATRFGAEIHAPARVLDAVRRPRSIRRYPYRHLLWGIPEEASRVKALGDSLQTTRHRLDVIPTPGHTRDHVAFFEPERRALFTGDLYTGPKVRMARRVENVADQISSLERVLALKPRLMICYHKGPIEDPIPALEAKLAFMKGVRDEALRLRDKGLRVGAIARRVLGLEEPLVFGYTMGDFTKARLVEAALHPPGHYTIPIG